MTVATSTRNNRFIGVMSPALELCKSRADVLAFDQAIASQLREATWESVCPLGQTTARPCCWDLPLTPDESSNRRARVLRSWQERSLGIAQKRAPNNETDFDTTRATICVCPSLGFGRNERPSSAQDS